MTIQQRIEELPKQGFYLLLVYMPFHVFIVQWLSLYTGGLAVWKGLKDAVALFLVALTVILVWTKRKTTREFNWFVWLAIAYAAVHMLVWVLNPHIYKDSALLGSVYNNRLLWFLVLGMGVSLLWPKISENSVLRLVVFVSTVVCALGILQYFLPKDLMTHFGYSVARGVKPAFFIDDKPNLPRIMSTLRDPNSLGAYLILPITILFYKLVTVARDKRQLIGGLLFLHGLTLFLTFSRSAWIGAVVSVTVLAAYAMRAKFVPWLLKYWPLLLGTVLLVSSVALMYKGQYAVQNILVHSDKSTAAKSQHDSNGYHWLYARRGLEGIAKHPLGNGPGTAGLVSIQHPDTGFLTENYYIQVGYEVGVVGLLIFLAVNILVYRELMKRKSLLPAALLASFWGYVVCNMLLHTWSNEAVASQWWLLAGLAVGVPHVIIKKSSVKKVTKATRTAKPTNAVKAIKPKKPTKKLAGSSVVAA